MSDAVHTTTHCTALFTFRHQFLGFIRPVTSSATDAFITENNIKNSNNITKVTDVEKSGHFPCFITPRAATA